VPKAVVTWPRRSDREVFDWAQARQAIIIIFDEDFADQRSFPVGGHHGVVRLRVWPTTIEETQDALERLLGEVSISFSIACPPLCRITQKLYRLLPVDGVGRDNPGPTTGGTGDLAGVFLAGKEHRKAGCNSPEYAEGPF
jgi:hypothetical protein